jgi:hypothetical protein
MKKTNFLYASAITMAFAFGMTSCEQSQDNPVPQPDPEPVFIEETFIYDFEAAFNAGENPGNKNGNQNNGQGFYGWEKADKTDSKRNDYKGYEWAEGSVLPEVCHVWRRSDRINGNIKNGGLFCPNDREFAIDGLLEGALVQITYDPGVKEEKEDEVINLYDAAFYDCEGTFGKDAKKEKIATPEKAELGTVVGQGGMVYGDPSVNNYADLSGYSKMVLAVTAGTPRMLFNRDVQEGQWSENEADSHLIDNTKGGWSSKYFKADTLENAVIITVDLALMVQEKGYAHLHAIKNNWGAPDVVIGSITLVSTKTVVTPLDNKLLWAIGDGTSTEGLGVRATAEIDGVEAVPGQTEIASEANIRVKTITPADNGTGYIVVKVKKGMIIKKIVITNYIEQKDEE